MIERILIERAKKGDPAAAERLVRTHYPAVDRFLRHLTWNHPDAADLSQLTFLRAKDGLAAFRCDTSFRSWLHQIAYREYVRWLKTRRETLNFDEAREQVSPEVSDGLMLIAQAFDHLEEGLREVFLLREVEQHSVTEVATILGIPEGTVKSRLSRAKCVLRTKLQSLAPHSMETSYETTP